MIPKLKSDEPRFGWGEPLPLAKRILYNHHLDRNRFTNRFVGMTNRRSVCFMNSVLQCLNCVPVWSNYLVAQHPKECKVSSDDCFGCELSRTIAKVRREGKSSSVRTDPLVQRLRFLSKDLTPGKQHDAHEFLICLLGKMQESVIKGKVDPYVEMTTAVGQIFGGFLRSQIACQECFHTSNTYEQYFNVSLDIDGVRTLETAMSRFFTADNMGGCPWYTCDKCERKTMAAKRYTIETTPEVLIIQLKRYDAYGRKLNHSVDFPEILDMGKFMSQISSHATFRLYGVVSHSGRQMRSGHYAAYVTDPSECSAQWHLVDDEKIFKASWKDVVSSDAYLLFYVYPDRKVKKNYGRGMPEAKAVPAVSNMFSVLCLSSDDEEEENDGKEEGSGESVENGDKLENVEKLESGEKLENVEKLENGRKQENVEKLESGNIGKHEEKVETGGDVKTEDVVKSGKGVKNGKRVKNGKKKRQRERMFDLNDVFE